MIDRKDIQCIHLEADTRESWIICAAKVVPPHSHWGVCINCPHRNKPLGEIAPVPIGPAMRQEIIDMAHVAVLLKAADDGLGAQVEALASRIGADKFAAAWEWMTGKTCGCTARKKWLNDKWPGGWRQVLGLSSSDPLTVLDGNPLLTGRIDGKDAIDG
jgi:hypothetical protein